MRDAAQLGHTLGDERRPEGSLRRRVATLGVAATLSQPCAVAQSTGEDHEGRGSAAAAASRRRASRRDATTSRRPVRREF